MWLMLGAEGKRPHPGASSQEATVQFHIERLVLSGAHGVKLLICKGRGTSTYRNPWLTGRPNHVQNQSYTAVHECISFG